MLPVEPTGAPQYNYQLPHTPTMYPSSPQLPHNPHLPQTPIQQHSPSPQLQHQLQQQLPPQGYQQQQYEQPSRRGSGRKLPVAPDGSANGSLSSLEQTTSSTSLPPGRQRAPSISVEMMHSPTNQHGMNQLGGNPTMQYNYSNGNANRLPTTPNLLENNLSNGGMNQSVSGYTLTAQQTHHLHNAMHSNSRLSNAASDQSLFNNAQQTLHGGQTQGPPSTSSSSVALHSAANKLNAMCADTIARVRKMSADPRMITSVIRRMFRQALQNMLHNPTTGSTDGNNEQSVESASNASQRSMSPEHPFDYDSDMIDRLLSPDFDMDMLPTTTKTKASAAPISVTCQKACGVGCVYLNVTYIMARRRLTVNLVRCDGIPTGPKGSAQLVLTAKIQLIPGKFQQYETKPVETTENRQAHFDQIFVFEECDKEDIIRGSLHIELSYEDSKKKECLLGSTDIPMTHVPTIRTRTESRLREELIPKFAKKLGKIQITTCLQTSSKCLTVNVIRADDLNKSMFTNTAPDPLVRMTLEQGDRSQTKQTRTLKHTCSAVYKEAIMFVIDVGKQQLQDTTLTIAIHDASRTSAGADLIGCCFLGKGAIDKSEFEQWKSTTHSTGREHKAVHNLKPPQPTQHLLPPLNETVFEESDIEDDEFDTGENVQTPQPSRGGYDPMAFEM